MTALPTDLWVEEILPRLSLHARVMVLASCKSLAQLGRARRELADWTALARRLTVQDPRVHSDPGLAAVVRELLWAYDPSVPYTVLALKDLVTFLYAPTDVRLWMPASAPEDFKGSVVLPGSCPYVDPLPLAVRARPNAWSSLMRVFDRHTLVRIQGLMWRDDAPPVMYLSAYRMGVCMGLRESADKGPVLLVCRGLAEGDVEVRLEAALATPHRPYMRSLLYWAAGTMQVHASNIAPGATLVNLWQMHHKSMLAYHVADTGRCCTCGAAFSPPPSSAEDYIEASACRACRRQYVFFLLGLD